MSQWTTKLYEFERGQPPLPPLIYQCCRSLARRTPWADVYGSISASSGTDSESSAMAWKRWRDEYEPDAGIVNFVRLSASFVLGRA